MFNWKKVGVVMATSLSLIAAGCGSGDEEAADTDKEDLSTGAKISEELDYTITGIDPGAGQTETNEIAIEEYDSLTGWEQELSSSGAMLSALDTAISNEEPIIIAAWSPHYMFANWDIKYLEDPKGIFDEGSFITITREDLEEDMPEANEILDRLQWETDVVQEALLVAVNEEKEFDVVAQEWAEENPDKIEEWVDGVDTVSGESIELVHTAWDAETFTAEVAGIVLSEHGYDVTLTPVDPAIVFESISTGEADASLSPSMPVNHKAFYEEYEGSFVDLGENVPGARIGLAVPAYLDIDSIEDLVPNE